MHEKEWENWAKKTLTSKYFRLPVLTSSFCSLGEKSPSLSIKASHCARISQPFFASSFNNKTIQFVRQHTHTNSYIHIQTQRCKHRAQRLWNSEKICFLFNIHTQRCKHRAQRLWNALKSCIYMHALTLTYLHLVTHTHTCMHACMHILSWEKSRVRLFNSQR